MYFLQARYKNNFLRKVCTNYTKSCRFYGSRMAELIHLRIDQLNAAETVEEMINFSIGRCHQLNGNREGQYALDLVHPYRLIFVKIDDQIQIVKIIEIVDYH